MIKSFIINKYLAREFIKIILAMTFAFFCLSFILNLEMANKNIIKNKDYSVYS